VAALALVAIGLAWRKRRPEARRFGIALLVTALAGAPFTLWQNVGAETYSAMAKLGFAAAFTSSSFADTIQQWLGRGVVGWVLATPAFGLWLAGYLGSPASRRRSGSSGTGGRRRASRHGRSASRRAASPPACS